MHRLKWSSVSSSHQMSPSRSASAPHMTYPERTHTFGQNFEPWDWQTSHCGVPQGVAAVTSPSVELFVT